MNMNENNDLITSYNHQLLGDYKRRIMQKNREKSLKESPVKVHSNRMEAFPEPKMVKMASHTPQTATANDPQAANDLQLTKGSHSTDHSLINGGIPKENEILKNMLRNCCVLMNPNEMDTYKDKTKKIRKIVSISSMSETIHEDLMQKETLKVSEQSKSDIQATIDNHNMKFKKNRSSSTSNRSTCSNPKTTAVRDIDPFAKKLKKKVESIPLETEKKGRVFIDSFKGMIPGDIFRPFRKKTAEKEAEKSNFFGCACASDKKYQNVKWESQNGCVRSVNWLGNKYAPEEAHHDLQEYFVRKQREKPLPEAIREQISKDTVRTFSSDAYLSSQAVRQRLESLLGCVALVYPQIGYVQGMNFIAAAFLFHCDQYYSLGIFKIIFEQLELKDIFLPSKPRCD
jgi:hypothetical protein